MPMTWLTQLELLKTEASTLRDMAILLVIWALVLAPCMIAMNVRMDHRRDDR